MAEKSELEDREYSSANYWEQRYKNGDFVNHEWYFNFETLLPLFETIFEASPLALPSRENPTRILEIGCGDMPLTIGFHQQFHKSFHIELHGMDISPSVIDTLNRNKISIQSHENLIFSAMDARSLKYDHPFELIIDKGTMDAMLCNRNVQQGFSDVRDMISESCRLLVGSKLPHLDFSFLPSHHKSTEKEVENEQTREGRKAIGHIMMISHISIESEEFSQVMQSCFLPVLRDYPHRKWTITAHTLSSSSSSPSSTSSSSSSSSSTPSPVVDIDSNNKKRKSQRKSSSSSTSSDSSSSSIPSSFATVFIIQSSPLSLSSQYTRSQTKKIQKALEKQMKKKRKQEEEEEGELLKANSNRQMKMKRKNQKRNPKNEEKEVEEDEEEEEEEDFEVDLFVVSH